jgi:orotidine-5'-phosphate decarboxylase
VNASRAIIYASSKDDFADKAREVAAACQQEMSGYLEKLKKI